MLGAPPEPPSRRAGSWRWAVALVLALPAVGAGGAGCADLIGISDLPPVPEAGTDAKGDRGSPADAHAHDAGHEGGRPHEAGADGAEAGDAGSTVTLSVAPTGLHLLRGTTSPKLTVTVARTSAASKVSIALTGLPSGVTASPPALTIPASSTTGTFTLTATAAATLGAASVAVQGGGSSAPLNVVVADPTGTYDTSFGSGGGIVTYAPGGSTEAVATSVVILDDGSFIVTGTLGASFDAGWVLLHVKVDGAIDASFAPVLPTVGHATWVARGPRSGPLAHTLIVSGTSQNTKGPDKATVYVLTESGAPFTSFNGSGYYCEPAMTGSTTYAVAAGASSAGDVYFAANVTGTSGPYLTHLDAKGNPASSWNFANLPTEVAPIGILVDPADDMIVTGAYNYNQFFAQRFTPSSKGSPDPTFLGPSGGVFGQKSATLTGQTSAMDPDAGIYVGGAGTATGETPVLGHVTSGGAADLGDAGWVAQSFTVQFDIGYLGLTVQSDGRVVGVGNGNYMTGTLPWVARTSPGGALDPTFNADASVKGVYLNQSTTYVTYNAVAAAPLPDGRIVIAGGEPGQGMFFLRMWP